MFLPKLIFIYFLIFPNYNSKELGAIKLAYPLHFFVLKCLFKSMKLNDRVVV